ncbi:MAG: PaaI family thioesterase [Sporolactobacillus sp.]
MIKQWIQPTEQLDSLIGKMSSEDQTKIKNFIDMLRNEKKDFLFMRKLLGFHTKEITESHVVASIPVTEAISNGRNMVHGGIIALLADSAMGLLAAKLSVEDNSAVTSNLTMNFISPGRGRYLDALVQLIHSGRKTMVMNCRIENDQGKLIAMAQGTFFVVPGDY